MWQWASQFCEAKNDVYDVLWELINTALQVSECLRMQFVWASGEQS